MHITRSLLGGRVRLATRFSGNRVMEAIDTIHCASCNQKTSLRAAAHAFAAAKAPNARKNFTQSMTDFAWGTRGQSGCYEVARVAPQNIKMAKMMNGAEIPCERCKVVNWKAGVSAHIVRCEWISREAFARRKHSDEVEFRPGPLGMKLRDFKIGKSGNPVEPGDLVTVHYSSKSLHGRLMEDSSSIYPSGVSFVAGSRELVPPVLAEGVLGMKVGGKREIIAPPNTHFPEEYPGMILIYEVHLMNHRPCK